jgi:hypothetical protein
MSIFKTNVDAILASLLGHVEKLEKHADSKHAEAQGHYTAQTRLKQLEDAAVAERDRALRVKDKLAELLA